MKPETPLFVEKARESLVASRLLAANKLYDFAASRAYYTMFYISESDMQVLIRQGEQFIELAETTLLSN